MDECIDTRYNIGCSDNEVSFDSAEIAGGKCIQATVARAFSRAIQTRAPSQVAAGGPKGSLLSSHGVMIFLGRPRKGEDELIIKLNFSKKNNREKQNKH